MSRASGFTPQPQSRPPPSTPGDSATPTLPAAAVRLAAAYRPVHIKRTLVKRPDGLYYEPYSSVVDSDDEVCVLCVHRTPQCQVKVRYMPEREWLRIARRGNEVHCGVAGESSMHVVLHPEQSLLPASFRTVQAPPPPHFPAVAADTVTPSGEPAVFDYFVSRESRAAELRRRHKFLSLSSLKLTLKYDKADVQRMLREDCRAMLSVERRAIFLRQFQRDLQNRVSGTVLYTVGKQLPDHCVQTFFMAVEDARMRRRYQERMEAAEQRRGHGQPGRASTHQAATATIAGETATAAGREGGGGGGGAGRYLFTLDQVTASAGERLPFAGQAPVDGYVVVTVGPTRESFSAAWRPWTGNGRFSWLDAEDTPFEPFEYGTAAYIKAPPSPNREAAAATRTARASTALSEKDSERRTRSSSPLQPRYPEKKSASRQVSGVSSNGSSVLVQLKSALHETQQYQQDKQEEKTHKGGSPTGADGNGSLSGFSRSAPRLLWSAEGETDTTGTALARPTRVSVGAL